MVHLGEPRNSSLISYKKLYLNRCVQTNEIFFIVAETQEVMERYESYRLLLVYFFLILYRFLHVCKVMLYFVMLKAHTFACYSIAGNTNLFIHQNIPVTITFGLVQHSRSDSLGTEVQSMDILS